MIETAVKRLKELIELIKESPELFHDGIDEDIITTLEKTIEPLEKLLKGNK